MELGTEDIFLEANRKPGSVVQRFGNEGPGGSDAKTFSNALAAGMTIMNSTNRRAIVRVRPQAAPGSPEDIFVNGTGAAARKRSASIASAGSGRFRRQGSLASFAANDTPNADEGLEHKLNLGHLRRIAPHFLVTTDAQPQKLNAGATTTPTAHDRSLNTNMSNSGHGVGPTAGGAAPTAATAESIAFAQMLTTLQRRCENDLWLHGPPPIPAGTLSQLEPKKPEQFTHVKSAVSVSTLSQRHAHDTRSLDELSAREYDPKAILQRHYQEEREQRLREKQLNINKQQDPHAAGGKKKVRNGGGASSRMRSQANGSDSSDSDDGDTQDVSVSTRYGGTTVVAPPQPPGDVRDLMRELFTRQKRTLTEPLFVHAVLSSHVATATANGAQQLFRKIDVESSGEISFDSFLTFLVSNQASGGSSGDAPGSSGGSTGGNPATAQSSELVPVSVPRSCPPWHQHERLIATMAVSPRTGTVFTGGCDGCLRSWDPITLRHQKLWYSCNSWIIGIVFTFREQRLIICTVDRQVVVFDAKSGDVLRLYRGRRVIDTENGLSFAHESIPVVTVGGKVLSHAAPKGMKIRRTGAIAKQQQQAQQQQQQAQQQQQQGDASATTTGDAPGGGAANNSDGKKKPAAPTNGGGGSGKHQGAMSFEQYRALLEEEKNNQLERRRLEEYILAGLTEPPSCVEYHFSKADEDVLFFGMDDGSIRIFIIPTSHQRLVRQHFRLRPHTARVRKMQVIPQLEGVLSCADDGSLKLTHLVTGQVIKNFCNDAHESSVSCFAYSSVLKLFISSGGERHGFVWDQLQESPVARLDEHACPTLACAINEAEWQFITIGIDNSVFVFSARTYKLIQQFHERIRAGLGPLPSSSEVAPAGAANKGPHGSEAAMALAASTTNQHLYSVSTFDGPRQRLILGTTYPVMHQLRRNVATLPPHYCGHTSPVVATLYNTTFHMVLTIDAEHLVLGWDFVTGQSSGLSFSISSFASPHDDLRLTACALDVMQRRLITGFHVGTVVVWNVFNGQSLCVIKAALAPMSLGHTAPPAASSSTRRLKEAKQQHQKSSGGVASDSSDESDGSDEDRSSDGTAASTGNNSDGADDASRRHHAHHASSIKKKKSSKKSSSSSSLTSTDVIAVAAIQRDSTHYMFSLGQTLVILKETPSFTVANPPRYRVPSTIGSVAVLAPCSSVLVALGTTTGAVSFFNIASETMDGSPLWADETAIRTCIAVSLLSPPDSIGSTGANGVWLMEAFASAGLRKLPNNSSNTTNSTTPQLSSPNDGHVNSNRRAAAGGALMMMPPTSAMPGVSNMSSSVVGMLMNAIDGSVGCVDGVGLSRIVALFPMKKFQQMLLLALHADGKLVLWDVPHRRCVGVYSVVASETFTQHHHYASSNHNGENGNYHQQQSNVNIVNAGMDEREEFLVHGDDAGNVTVVRLTFECILSAAPRGIGGSPRGAHNKAATAASSRSSSPVSISRKSSSSSPKVSHVTAAPEAPPLSIAPLLSQPQLQLAAVQQTSSSAPPPAITIANDTKIIITDIHTVSHFFGLTTSLTALCVTNSDAVKGARLRSPNKGATNPSPTVAATETTAPPRAGSPHSRRTVVIPDISLGPSAATATAALQKGSSSLPAGSPQLTAGGPVAWGPLTTSSVIHSVDVPDSEAAFFSNASFASQHIGASGRNGLSGGDIDVPSDVAIVTTSTDFFSRVFDLHGHHIGDFGMHRWKLTQPSTFRVPDRAHTPLLPSTTGDGADTDGAILGSDDDGDFLSTLVGGGRGGQQQPAINNTVVSPTKDFPIPRVIAPSPSPRRNVVADSNANDVVISVIPASVMTAAVTPLRRDIHSYILPEILTPSHAEQQQQQALIMEGMTPPPSNNNSAGQQQRPSTNHINRAGGGPVRTQRAGIVKAPQQRGGYDASGYVFGVSGMESTTRMSFSTDGDHQQTLPHGSTHGSLRKTAMLSSNNNNGSMAMMMMMPQPPTGGAVHGSSVRHGTTPPMHHGSFAGGAPPQIQTVRLSLTSMNAGASGGGGLLPAFGGGGLSQRAPGTPNPQHRGGSFSLPVPSGKDQHHTNTLMGGVQLGSPGGGQQPPRAKNNNTSNHQLNVAGMSGLGGGDAFGNSFRPPTQLSARGHLGSMSSMSGLIPTAPSTTTTTTIDSEAARTKLLTGHLDRQLQRLQSCKPDLNQELRRIETRIRKSDGGPGGGGGGDGGDLSKLSWTSRVAARLELHELDDIQPPAGSRASNDAGRRTHNRIRQLQKGGGAGGAVQQGGQQQRAPDFFPSVTAPGTVLVGINDGAPDDDE